MSFRFTPCCTRPAMVFTLVFTLRSPFLARLNGGALAYPSGPPVALAPFDAFGRIRTPEKRRSPPAFRRTGYTQGSSNPC